MTETKRDYCTGCRRWIATWERAPWGSNTWRNGTLRPIFGKYCDHGKWCRDCWADHETRVHVEVAR